MSATYIAENLARVQERIAEAALRSGRDPASVTLVAVCKNFATEMVVSAYEAGARHFGENRVEEGQSKIPAVAALLAGPRPTWHMVGHVQSRKAQDVAATFDYVHSVDSLRLAQRLSRFAVAARRVLPVLLECNVSGEESKFGFHLDDWDSDSPQREGFLVTVAEMLALTGLVVEGLMTMAPLVGHPEAVRPVFSGLRGLLHALQARCPAGAWRHLSMGMTDDFEVAVEEGATMVRVGRAIFGVRPT